jgi:hypothetical protein
MIDQHFEPMKCVHGYEQLSSTIDGAEVIELFTPNQLEVIMMDIGAWYQVVKDEFPSNGSCLLTPRETGIPSDINGIPLNNSTHQLLTAMLQDAHQNYSNKDKPTAKILLERTGLQHSDYGDSRWHVDTSMVYFDDDLNRIGYENLRGPEKYMVFVNRPGTLVIEGRVDPGLTYDQVIVDVASQYMLNGKEGVTHTNKKGLVPRIAQLDPKKIWKVAVGDLLHAPSPHNDGLLITMSMVD